MTTKYREFSVFHACDFISKWRTFFATNHLVFHMRRTGLQFCICPPVILTDCNFSRDLERPFLKLALFPPMRPICWVITLINRAKKLRSSDKPAPGDPYSRKRMLLCRWNNRNQFGCYGETIYHEKYHTFKYIFIPAPAAICRTRTVFV